MALAPARFFEIFNDFPTSSIEAADIMLVYKPSTGQTHGILGSDIFPTASDDSQYQWSSTTTYAIGDAVLYNQVWWESLTAGNTGNIPSEGANWTQVNKVGSGTLQKWEAGLYTNDVQYVEFGAKLYELNAAPATPRPFNSATDPATDTANWTLISGNAVTEDEIQNNTFIYDEDSGSADAYDITLVPAVTAYQEGQSFIFKATNANTGASTLEVNGLSAQDIVRRDGSPLEAGDIPAGSICVVVYDGTNFQLVSASGGGETDNWQFLKFEFDGSSQADSDPTQGKFRLNNADPALSTFIYVDNLLPASLGGNDIREILDSIEVGDRIAMQQEDNPAKNVLFEVVTAAVDGGGYRKIEVTVLSAPPSVIFDDTALFGWFIFDKESTISGTDVRERVEFSPDFDTVRAVTYIMPSQLTDVVGNGITAVSYRAALNDGNFNYTDYASIAALNTYLDGLADGTQVLVERTVTINYPDSILVINNIA